MGTVSHVVPLYWHVLPDVELSVLPIAVQVAELVPVPSLQAVAVPRH